MYSNKKISLVIPCYNEEKGLKRILQKKPLFIDEVIVVDNNSDDGTASIARQYGATVLSVKERGYGLAYQRGLSQANGDIIVMIDGDNSYPISEVEKFLIHMETKDYDFLTGRRFPLTDKRAMPFVKRLSNHFISYLVRKYLRINLIDSMSGMFVLKNCLLKESLALSSGMTFTAEIKLKAWLTPGIKCGELHINYHTRIGTVKFRPMQDGIRVLYDVLFFILRHANRNKTSIK